MKKISLGQALGALKPHLLNEHELIDAPHKSSIISEFSVDTRTLKKGSIYIALKGEKVDGHLFLEEAKKKGALAAIISTEYRGPTFHLIPIRVQDPLKALQELAKNTLAQRKSRIVGVTGSVGKTTTKEFIASFLKAHYRIAASPGNSNSQIGLPLTILNHTDGTEEILVLEMGMTLPGQLSRLTEIAPPEVAVITTVALVHAMNFPSIEAIACAKGEILTSPHTKLGILPNPIANSHHLHQVGSCLKQTFSMTNSASDYFLKHEIAPGKQQHSYSYAIVDKFIDKELHLGNLELPGKHNLHNILAAAAVARYFNIDWSAIIETCQRLILPERRLQYIKKNDFLFINDSYNASELSVMAALESLPTPQLGGRKIAVLGSMMELGKFSDECHKRVGAKALNHVDHIFCLGQECMPIYQEWIAASRPAHLFLDRASLVEALKQTLLPHDVILLKGSRSKELWKVLDELD